MCRCSPTHAVLLHVRSQDSPIEFLMQWADSNQPLPVSPSGKALGKRKLADQLQSVALLPGLDEVSHSLSADAYDMCLMSEIQHALTRPCFPPCSPHTYF